MAFGIRKMNDFHCCSTVLCIFTFLILRSFSVLPRGFVEFFWASLSFILPLKLLGASLGAASGSLTAHNHSTNFKDPDFGALADLLEALLVASRWPRDLQSLQIRCPELFRKNLSSILISPHLNLSSRNEILSSRNSFQSTSAA